jgi:hypothetical protein
MNRLACAALLCAALAGTASAVAQDAPHPSQADAFSRKNTFTLFAEYSNTSSPILMGAARQRILADFGGAYTRRVVRFWGSDLAYHVEVRPVLFESDPLQITKSFTTVTLPPPTGTISYTEVESAAIKGECQPYSGVRVLQPVNNYFGGTDAYTITCGRQWTFGQAFSPIGFKYSLRTRHPLQPFIVGTLGYMYTSRPVPVADAEALNFIFNFGTGIELYKSRTNKRSISIECRYNHFSNRNTAPKNPGTDNILYKLSYSFGR